MEIHCKIKEILNERGVKQTFVAKKAGVSLAAFNVLANNRGLPTLEVAYRIADVLDLPVEEIWVKQNNSPVST
ncbi:helix-turn-helix transcriptional regulator [Brevibacillus centrosporus]|uniref:helix-turn-helix transcriptional regulator n=1 Tax=Brevibacillus centrosporus TaxID=54910 RepID=UPI002E201479|nr:helix-turn-helix domain-containing protein [Brevibacillus centrosporus]